VAVGTVRAQIKSMLAKLGVSRQVEFVARLNEF
jgi:DNA-binding CsgD family transcriptional regulator